VREEREKVRKGKGENQHE